jgi:hypothetical protein
MDERFALNLPVGKITLLVLSSTDPRSPTPDPLIIPDTSSLISTVSSSIHHLKDIVLPSTVSSIHHLRGLVPHLNNRRVMHPSSQGHGP